MAGATICQQDLRNDGATQVLGAIVRYGVTTLRLVPSVFRILARLPGAAPALAGVRHIRLAGEPVLRGDVLLAREVTDPRCKIENCYGATEGLNFPWVSPPERLPDGQLVPAGTICRGAEFFMRDDAGDPIVPGEVGELVVSSRSIAIGDWVGGRIDATRFPPDPRHISSRLYATGDLARLLPDGNLLVVGRKDQMLKINGQRVSPIEVESHLQTMPGCAGAAILPLEQGGTTRLVAFLVPDPACEMPPHPAEWLAERLPLYMVPYRFQSVPEMPLLPGGKIDRLRLRAWLDALPATESIDSGTPYRTPRDVHEALLCRLFAELTGTSRVGIDDGFFALGGHSLLALRLIAQLRQDHGLELPLQALFEHPTPGTLAAHLVAAPPARTAPVAVGRTVPLPLSLQQAQFHFLEQLEGYRGAFTLPLLAEIRGPLDAAALARALAWLSDRYDILRCRVLEVDGEHRQQSAPAGQFRPTVEDWRRLDPAERDGRLARLHATPLDPREAVFAATLLRTSDACWLLALRWHHIAHDGWSLGLLCSELPALYATALGGGAPPPPDRLHYADAAAWQRQTLAAGGFEADLGYWRGVFATLPVPLTLPSDRPRPVAPSFRAGRIGFVLPPPLVAGLKQLADASGSTLFMLLEAALATLLYRYSGVEDLVVGTIVAGRFQPEFARTIGPFLNVLPLRHQLHGAEPFAEVLARGRTTLLEALQHGEVPYDAILHAVAPARSLSLGHQPLFQVLFHLHTEMTAQASWPPALPGLALTVPTGSADRAGGVARHDLVFDLYEAIDGGLNGELEYAAEMFDADRMQRLLGHFSTLLQSILAAPATPVGRLEILTPEEKRQLAAWSAPVQVPVPAGETILDLFERQVRATPAAVALVDGARHVTYAEFDVMADALAGELAALGAGRDTVVGLAADGSLGFFVGLWGIWKAGAGFLSLDLDLPRDRLAFVLADGQPVALVDGGGVGRLAGLAGDLPVIEWLAARPTVATVPPTRPRPEDLGYLLYTSGSTGLPKGVEMTHAGLRNLGAVMARHYPAGPDDRILQLCLPSFVRALEEYVWAFCSGASLYLYPRGAGLDGAALAAFIDARRITRICTVPVVLRLLPARRYAALHQMVVAGEPLAQDLADAWAPHLDLYNEYGTTETVGIVTGALRHQAGAPVLIGRPLANCRVQLLDPNGQPVPQGIAGEIHVGGPQVARAYRNLPAMTAERLPADPGGRLFRTGDLARWYANGALEHLGRRDFQVQVRGMRVEPAEIEAALARHPAVLQAVVVGRTDPDGLTQLAAYLVGHQADDDAAPVAADLVGPDGLRAQLGALPVYMHPASFTWLPAFPRTPSGKIDRAALPAPEGIETGTLYRAPRDTREALLCRLFAELTGATRVGIDDDFFQLGGHSLVVMRLVAQLRRDTGRDIPPRLLFQGPTPRAFAAALAAPVAAGHRRTPLVELQPFGDRRPFFCVHSIGGGLVHLRHLARRMGTARPFLGLDASPDDDLTDDIQSIAARYLSAIQARQPDGPYLLGGYSFGAAIAYEIACQLREGGQDIALLAVLDGAWPEWKQKTRVPLAALSGWVRNLPGFAQHEARHLSARHLARRTGRTLRRAARRLRGLPADAASLLDVGTFAPETVPLVGAHLQALRRYQPRHVKMPVELFQAEVRPLSEFESDTGVGWRTVSAGVLRIHSIPGNHFRIIHEPYVDRLAEVLVEAIDRRDAAWLDARPDSFQKMNFR